MHERVGVHEARRGRTGARVKQLGDILLEGGLLSPHQLEAAYEEQERGGRSLGRVLVDQGVLTESQLVAALATQIGLRFVDLGEFAVDGSAIGRVPGAVCRRHSAMPIGFEDGKLLVAMADPANVFAVDDIRSLTGMDVKPVVATRADVARRHRPLLPRRRRPRRPDQRPRRRRGGRGPLQGQGDRRGRADRQVRQPADHPGDPGPRLGHPPGAEGDTTCGSASASTACCTR